MLVEQPVTLSRDEARNIYAAESPRLTINWERNTLNQVIGGAWIRYVGGIFESSGRLSLGDRVHRVVTRISEDQYIIVDEYITSNRDI